LAELAVHRLDLVISDIPLPPSISVKAFTHLLGRSSVSFFAAPALLKRFGWTLRRAQATFPHCVGELPLLYPGPGTALRPRLDGWLREEGLTPQAVGEFEDSALIKAFGRQGAGIFAGPTVLREEIEEQYQVKCLGSAQGLIEEFFALSIERRIVHPAVAAITANARRELFR
jgi:LysR family transcriptional activator of nhaA